MNEGKEQIVLRLENLVRKVKVQTQDSGDVECRIFPPLTHGNPYIIEVSHEKYVRRVSADLLTVQNLDLGHPDPMLMRDLRTAILAVTRLSRRR